MRKRMSFEGATLRALLILCVCKFGCSQNGGKFWHISDQHLDPYYNENEVDKTQVCPSSYGDATIDAGPLGDYRCDSPWKLINSSVYAMKLIEPNPDFIIWTGDDTMHTGEQEKYLGQEKVLEVIGNITALMMEVFPETRFFSALGNHDYHPKSQIPPSPNTILSAIAEMWKDWLGDGYDSFKSAGYYSRSFGPQDEHLMVVLNSNFWYDSNKQVDGTGDPASEFAWMEDTLRVAQRDGKKVFIIGHVPPGYFELESSVPKKWYYPNYNEKFIEIVRSYYNVIAGMFFGHHHTDTFKIFRDSSGNTVSSMLLAPGVTPWTTTLPGVVKGANNPGIRLFEYDANSLVLKDYLQYYLDLPVANKQAGDASELWKLEYRATEKYGMSDINTPSWAALAKTMREGCEDPDSECPSSFADYYLLNSVSYNTAECDEDCQKFQLCAVTEVDFSEYQDCQENWGNGGYRPSLTITVLLFSIFTLFKNI